MALRAEGLHGRAAKIGRVPVDEGEAVPARPETETA